MTTPEIVEEFKRLGGDDDFLEDSGNTKDNLPEGHLTRGFQWPETCHELDPDLIQDWLTQTLQQQRTELLEEVRKGVPVSPSMSAEEYSDSATELECFQDGFDDCRQQLLDHLDHLTN